MLIRSAGRCTLTKSIMRLSPPVWGALITNSVNAIKNKRMISLSTLATHVEVPNQLPGLALKFACLILSCKV